MRSYRLVTIMNDRTPAQINNSLDRTEQILSDLTVRLDRLTVLSEQIGERTKTLIRLPTTHRVVKMMPDGSRNSRSNAADRPF